VDFITEDDRYLFGRGIHYEIYNKLGAHITKQGNKLGVHFAVWAPMAEAVSVTGDFNNWEIEKGVMTKIGDSGIWEVFLPEAKKWDIYKYAITKKDGTIVYKADPYGTHSEVRPDTASKICDIDKFKWADKRFLNKQEKMDPLKEPMSIYEVHLGSFLKDYERNEDGFMDYISIANELSAYIKKMGYTHVELMGIAEYPYDASWGYQVTGYYAPTSRYGGPYEFMEFVNIMHKNNIGVILDWVPAHFPKDECGLSEFDGSCLYEYPDKRKGEHPDWGTKVFNYEKNEVKNFLIANALFWIEKYHIDALRVDAVASMLYLDYGRRGGEWIPNKYGDNKNLEAIEFLKHLNSIVSKRSKRAFLIAEESTAFPYVTKTPEEGGLGFKFKWNMGWMNDFTEYLKTDPLFKGLVHHKATFSLTYSASENYILVFSHDEVVHLKCSMLNKMPGFFVDKVANLKSAYSFMIGHPGKKLLFMGQDFGMLKEWNENSEIEWNLLERPLHMELNDYVRKLLNIYKKYEVLYAFDNIQNSFKWINANDSGRSIFSFLRINPLKDDYKKTLLFICNFTPLMRENYSVGVPKAGKYKEILTNFSPTKEEDINSLILEEEKNRIFISEEKECDGYKDRITFNLRPFESLIIEIL